MKVQADRQNYIDWLRSGAMFLLVFYHTGRLFDEPGWHIKNAILNDAVNSFNRFLDIWHMPLFFLLAGASVWFALNSRSPRGFTWERTLRLFIPLVFGMLIIVPPQVYFQRVFEGDFSGSFLAWYLNTFTAGPYPEGNLSWHHLWFLAYLFVFSLILVPLFWYLHKAERKPVISRLAAFLEKPGAIFLPAIPLIIINLALRPHYGWGNQNLIDDWANFLFYATVFFYGFLLVADSRVLQAIQRHRYVALVAGLITAPASGLLTSVLGNMDYSAGWLAAVTLVAFSCWCWLVAVIGIGSRLLNFSNRLVRYAADAVLPVYILHQTLIVTLGFYVIQWNTGVGPKYFFVAFATLVSSLAVYEVVKRIGVTRFLFGMKAKKRLSAMPVGSTG